MKFANEIGNINAGLFLFYLALVSNYTMDRILPPDLIKFFDNSRMGKHLVAFLILLFTINLYTPKLPFYQIVIYTFGIWVWYILTSKQHLVTSLIILGLLLASYIAFNISSDLDDHINKTEDVKRKEKAQLVKFQTGCFIGIGLVSIIGGYSYFIEHYRQYRSEDSSFLNFLGKYLFMGKGDRSKVRVKL